jgi:hypothetical protein
MCQTYQHQRLASLPQLTRGQTSSRFCIIGSTFKPSERPAISRTFFYEIGGVGPYWL